ncbi:tyrosine--tRNA ligase [Paenibacillus psychroresistens]|uniref:Tyrosine--tRNA ligase n=1 Tax=Paenibacillus psychroresistens TaxID=1778678 RepID=A0A6B8RMQ9_9BACL|nr:tyrosine--tRNA ligase [Paenibacillus psychroresistens]QGQ96972.1 tyrosine--tRNA ligase [Paenibacillus psychroresistens]
MDILQDLMDRGLLHQVTDQDGLNKKLNEGPITLYAGFDPTADSLHIGSLVPILCLVRFQKAGHIPVALVGGGTGLIGDPSGKASERTLNTAEVVDQWTEKLRIQLSRFLDFNADQNPAQMANNYDWFKQLNVIEFLRDIGKHFPLNYMLAKDSVDSRLSKGISFTEFSYMILQAYDFLKLSQENNCSLQIGGSDQWGNITAGMELIGRTTGNSAFGLTFPLVTKSDGTKFGKTESGTIWLDASKTSPYQFYQFWLNVDDQDVIRFLKYFTFLSIEEIRELEGELKLSPELRTAQRALAREVTALVHGDQAVASSENISQLLFNGQIEQLSGDEIEQAFQDVPSVEITNSEAIGLVDLLITAQASPSKRQARQDIESGAIYINGARVIEVDKLLAHEDRLSGKYIVIRRGKKNYYLVKFIQ